MEHPHEERQHLDLVRKILATGVDRPDRNAVSTRSIFGHQMRFNLRNGTLPLFTTRQINFEWIAKELLWIISGSTNVKDLHAENVRLWNDISSRGYLVTHGFHGNPEHDVGPVYGFQWHHFGAEYKTCGDDYTGQGIDQLKEVIETIRNDPFDRRIIICSWNVEDLRKMVLKSRHCLVQFYVANGELSSQLYTRSADVGLDVPATIASYALLTHMIAHVTNLKPGEFIHTTGDTFFYHDHAESLKTQVEREPKQFPKLEFKRKVAEIGDFKYEDLELLEYESHPAIKFSKIEFFSEPVLYYK